MIPNCVKQKQLEDKVEKLSTYSTEEVKIGTWIDGKPLYMKIIDNTITDTNGYNTFNIGDLKIDKVVKYNAFLIDESGSVHILNEFNPNSNSNVRVSISPSIEYIVTTNATSYAGCTVRCFLEYTKTTD